MANEVVMHGLNNLHISEHEGQPEDKVVCLLHEMLGFDHLISIFINFDGFFSSKLALVCKEWHRATMDTLCWQAWCAQVWWRGRLQNQLSLYGSYKDMFINRPHVRFDRLYMLERSWFRPAGADSAMARGTVIKTGWYRYLRFRPQGKVLYTLTAHPIRNLKESYRGCKVGQYIYHHGKLEMNIDMEYMDGFMQVEFVCPALGGLMHDGLKVCTYNAVYKGDHHRLDPPGMFTSQKAKEVDEEAKT